MPDLALLPPDGDDYLYGGMNSYTRADHLSPGYYVSGMNLVHRGGLPQTRPGTRTLFTLPRGIFQGITFFKPANGIPYLVFAVSGSVYISAYPFLSYSQLDGIQFSVQTRFMAWAVCLKSTDYDAEGNIIFVDNPYSVLVMQDGSTRAAYWDGTTARHLNPTQSNVLNAQGDKETVPGMDETPMGLWMAWSNNRLWVSRGNQIFASDIGNPLKFTESQYLNEGRAFYLPGECTGIIETQDKQGILAFTENTGSLLLTSVQDRTLWLSTPNFQQTVFPDIGCVSPRSLVRQYGLIWWFSSRGLMNQNDAQRENLSSRVDIQDNQMFVSKYNLSYDLSGVCGTFYENYLVQSVPNGDRFNRHTWVLDQAPFNGNDNAWSSFWTGWRPIEWARGIIGGQERAFFGSVDYDNNLRVWEAFRPEKTDNGVPITCFLQTRQHLFGNRDYKRYAYSELGFSEIYGDASFSVYAAGSKGAYQGEMVKEVVSTIGQVYADQKYGLSHAIAGSRPQERIVRTTGRFDPSDCNAECIESKYQGLTDKSFSLLVIWSGWAALSFYRILAYPFTEAYQGTCEDNESGDRLLTPSGCGVMGKFSSDQAISRFSSTFTFSKDDPSSGKNFSYTATRTSFTSQSDADRQAQIAATNYVLKEIGQII